MRHSRPAVRALFRWQRVRVPAGYSVGRVAAGGLWRARRHGWCGPLRATFARALFDARQHAETTDC